MSWNRVKPQSRFLYDEKWTLEKDATCLGSFVSHKRQIYWVQADEPPPSAILNAMADVNSAFGVNLLYDDLVARVAFFKKRLKTLTGLLKLTGASWDQVGNHVYLSDEWWQLLEENSPFTRAYYHQGEPEFNNLAFLFGPTELKDEDQPPVITISDTTVVVPQHDFINLEDSNSEEVSSPVVNQDNRRRRRLFECDAESTNWPTGGPQYPSRNAFPPHPNMGDGGGDDEGNSSCASSSPFKRSQNSWW